MQLPLALRPKGTARGTLALPIPRLVVTASGASICEASNKPWISLSRILAQDVSRTSAISSPSRSANPHSTAAIGMAASIRGIKPIFMLFIPAASFQHSLRHHDGAGDFNQPALLVHRRLAHQDIGLLLVEGFCRHQYSLGALDHLAVRQSGLCLAKF